MNILIACEESQRVCNAFRARGYEAYSCDIIDPSGGHPEWHIKDDVSNYLEPIHGRIDFLTMDGQVHEIYKWDLIIAHPPCTYLTTTGNRWFNVEQYGEKALERIKLREEAKAFFMMFINSSCKHVAVENPIGVMSTAFRKPDQIIQPWWFGDAAEKRTCLWLKGLPPLTKTKVVDPANKKEFESGKKMSAWYYETSLLPKNQRAAARSKTFPGFAEAMATQWGFYLSSLEENK